jgi:hypothetical protein
VADRWPEHTVPEGVQRHGNVLSGYGPGDSSRFLYEIKRFRQGQNGRDTNMLYLMTKEDTIGGLRVVVVRQGPLPNSGRQKSVEELVTFLDGKARELLPRGGDAVLGELRGVLDDGLTWSAHLERERRDDRTRR